MRQTNRVGTAWGAHAAWCCVLAGVLAWPLTAGQSSGERPPLVVDGQAVGWDRLRGVLAEAAGRAPVEELVLDLALEGELQRQGLRVDGRAVERERERLSAAIRRGAGADERGGAAVEAAVLRSRGLGPERLSAFLRRNAGLRALVGEDFDATDAEVDLAARVRTGPAVRARVLVVRTDREAASLRRELADADGRADPVRFGVAATELSTHATGDRGGLVERLSPDDPGWPAAVRDAARTLEPGRVSEVLAVDGGYALLLVESALPALPEPDDAARREIRREIAEGKQRVAMETLARGLVGSSRVTVFDASLRWAWEGADGPR